MSRPLADRLTEPQRRHLMELLNRDTGETRYWHPANSGEYRCAYALRHMGLLAGSAVSCNDAYYLNEPGLAMARGLMRAEGAE